MKNDQLYNLSFCSKFTPNWREREREIIKRGYWVIYRGKEQQE
jgi:hypothetical protein